MAICTYFLRGTCKFGSSCKNEHSQRGDFGNSSWHRNTSAATTSAGAKTFVLFTVESIKDDLTQNKDKPYWPLACYGCAKYEPTMITGIDQSMEELRVMAVAAKASGSVNDYVTYEANQIAAAENIYANVRNNITQFYEQAKKASDAVAASSVPSAFGTGTGSAFGGANIGTSFGNPTNGTTSGAPLSAFGAPTNTTTSIFGAPSTFGARYPTTASSVFSQPAKATTPVFGAPATSGAPATTSAFGTPSTNTATSAFGQTAFGNPAFGQPAFGKPAFGQTSTTPAGTTTGGTTSAFGLPAFGQSSLAPASSVIKPATGAFGAFANAGPTSFGTGAAATTTTANAAGAASPSTNTNTGGGGFAGFASSQPTSFASAINNAGSGGSGFGQPAFGNPSSAGAGVASGSSNPFGAAPTSVFPSGTPATGSNPFGNNSTATTTQPTTSAFGQQPNPFGGAAAGGNAFSQPQQAATSGAGSASAFSAFGTRPGGFGVAPPAPAPGPRAAAAAAANKKGPDFDNAKYNYRPGLVPQDAKLPPNYVQLLPEAMLAAFKALRFEWGKVPEWVPPVEVRTKTVGEALFS